MYTFSHFIKHPDRTNVIVKKICVQYLSKYYYWAEITQIIDETCLHKHHEVLKMKQLEWILFDLTIQSIASDYKVMINKDFDNITERRRG